MAIILDLETLAVDGAGSLTEPVSAPANYKDPAKIAAYVAEAQAAQVDKAALFPWTSRIIALGWCEETDDTEQVTLCNSEASEASALREFWARCQDGRQLIVTFNGRTFDLLVLMARSLLLGVPYHPLNVDRYRSPHPDLLAILTFNGAIPARSLPWYAKRFGLDTSDAFSGREVAQLYEDGNWDAIRSHCASDVRLTRQLGEAVGVLKRRPVVV